MGDGESMEGNVWEALNFAGFYKLDNLVAIIDVNRLGQSDPTPLQHDMNTYKYVYKHLLEVELVTNQVVGPILDPSDVSLEQQPFSS